MYIGEKKSLEIIMTLSDESLKENVTSVIISLYCNPKNRISIKKEYSAEKTFSGEETVIIDTKSIGLGDLMCEVEMHIGAGNDEVIEIERVDTGITIKI